MLAERTCRRPWLTFLDRSSNPVDPREMVGSRAGGKVTFDNAKQLVLVSDNATFDDVEDIRTRGVLNAPQRTMVMSIAGLGKDSR
jgi:hypothetical protein